MIAVTDGDTAHAGGVRSFNIVHVVADEERLIGADRELSEHLQQRGWIGFSPRQSIAADNDRKKAVQGKSAENSVCCNNRLVGRDCQAKMCAQSIESLG